jgi:aryl carrier-like protein
MTLRQKELAKLWSRVLGNAINEIGINDNFFDLGGDSIGAMKLVSEARMANIQLSMAQIFQYKRLNEMANILEESQSQPAKGLPFKAVPFAALDVDDVEAFTSMSIVPKLAQPEWKLLDVLPTRPLQEIAVKGTFKLPRYSTRYELFHFDSVVDKARLFKSCGELVARNEILRTVFVESMGQYYGVVLESIDIPVTEFEIEGDLEAFSQKLCDVDIQTRMPLGSPFVKFTFVQGDDGKSTLIFRLSHAQYDEMCLPQMLHQLSALYEGNSVAESVPFSSFVNHVVRESIPRSFDYWRDLLKGSSMTILRPDIPLQSRKSAALSRSFDISSRSKESTIATLPTAAWAMCLARALSIRDVTFGEVVSGRNIDLSNCDTVIGPCWQYVPFRVKFEEGWTILDLLNFIQNQHIASAPFESVGLKEIVENCTNWPKTVDWFDTVVHQAVDFVEALPFTSASSRMETIYPHLEPLREWKFQAFVKGDMITFEIVTFEAWIPKAEELFNELEGIMSQLVGQPDSLVFS